jgi:hypothetical protein
MALTITKLRNRIKLALGGTVASTIDQDDIVNEAGRLLHVMHLWKFTERPPVSLNFTQDQAYVDLPSDFGQAVEIRYNADALNLFRLATFAEIAELRSALITPPSTYHGAIVQPGQTSATAAMGSPRLELAPTPSAAVSDALKLWYRAKWTEITYSTGNEVANVPAHVETLLSELVAAVAQGYNERDAGSMSARLAEIEAGPLFQNAVTYDGMIQPDYGEIGPGAAVMGRRSDPITWQSVAAPS